MKIILIQGAENTGKTTLCNQIDEWLQRESLREQGYNFRIEMTKQFSKKNDFFAVYDIYRNETKENQEKRDSFKTRIFINSGSEKVCITSFEKFYKNEREEYYVKNQQPDLLITAIRPSNTNLYNKMKGLLGLDLSDLEKVELSSKTRCLYKEDASENLLIQLEKTPLQLIKEKIRALFS